MDEVTKGKKKMQRQLKELRRLHESGHQAAADANALADGYTAAMNQEKPDECKSAADMAGPAERARGGNPASVEDFNTQRTGNSRRVAVGARDLQQQPATVFQGVLASLRSNPYNFTGGTGFGGAFSGTDRPAEAPGDQVQVRGFDPAGSAGSYAGMQPVDIAPRGDDGYHQHRNSGTAPNGTHSLSNVTSHAVSNKSRLDIMKEALFGA